MLTDTSSMINPLSKDYKLFIALPFVPCGTATPSSSPPTAAPDIHNDQDQTALNVDVPECGRLAEAVVLDISDKEDAILSNEAVEQIQSTWMEEKPLDELAENSYSTLSSQARHPIPTKLHSLSLIDHNNHHSQHDVSARISFDHTAPDAESTISASDSKSSMTLERLVEDDDYHQLASQHTTTNIGAVDNAPEKQETVKHTHKSSSDGALSQRISQTLQIAGLIHLLLYLQLAMVLLKTIYPIESPMSVR